MYSKGRGMYIFIKGTLLLSLLFTSMKICKLYTVQNGICKSKNIQQTFYYFSVSPFNFGVFVA